MHVLTVYCACAQIGCLFSLACVVITLCYAGPLFHILSVTINELLSQVSEKLHCTHIFKVILPLFTLVLTLHYKVWLSEQSRLTGRSVPVEPYTHEKYHKSICTRVRAL